MDSKDFTGWMKTGLDIWLLSAEAGSVMALRMAHITAGGPAGSAEAKLMVIEKVQAVIELQTRFMTGALDLSLLGATQGTLNHYRKKVSANNQRLRKAL